MLSIFIEYENRRLSVKSVPSLQKEARVGRAPLTTACAPHFSLLKILFLKHYLRTILQKMIEKEIVTFIYNSRLTFLDSSQNCWQSNAIYNSPQ